MPVDQQFIITMRTKQGERQFVLFAGLLDLGHQSGLIAIENEILADLSQPEKDCWVVRSTGRFRGPDGDAIWSAHGDASPANSQMKGAYLRHAETRAAARMLRIATNVGMTAFEELGQVAEDERETRMVEPSTGSSGLRKGHAVNPTESVVDGPGKKAMVADRAAGPLCTTNGCGTILSDYELNGCTQAGWPLMCTECARDYKKGLKLIEERKAVEAA